MFLPKQICLAFAALSLVAGSAFAVPYASKIRLAQTTVTSGDSNTITYFLNESANSVTIEILNTLDQPVATFPGTTTSGANSVTWNGTINNGAGAAVPAGSYRVAITANKTNTAWAEVASQRSAGNYGPPAINSQVYDGFSPNDMLFVTDPSSDFFGRSWSNSSYGWGTNPTVASVEFSPDLTVADGTNGLDSRVMRMTPLDGTVGATSAQYSPYFWGGSLDPLSADTFFYTGQTEPTFWRVNLNTLTLENADPDNHLGANLPRAVLVVSEAGVRYAYFAIGYTIQKAPMTATQLSGPPVTVADFSADLRYSRQLRTDTEGNLYWVTRATGTSTAITAGQNGRLYRWNYADTLGPNPTLTAANAAWEVLAAGDMQYMTGPAISPTDGNVYVGFANGSSVTPAATNGVYLVGNKADASIKRTLALTDRVIDLYGMGWHTSNVYTQLRTDPAGNVIVIDRNQEHIHAYTPGGVSNVRFTAPTSQALTINPLANVDNWSIY